MTASSTTTRRIEPAGGGTCGLRRRGGFTLVELLVVIFILAVLVKMIVGVGDLVYEQAWKGETRKRLATIVDAIEAYHAVQRAYPSEWAPRSVSPRVAGESDPRIWGADFADAGMWKAYWRNQGLRAQLQAVGASRKVLAKLPPAAVDRREIAFREEGRIKFRKLNCFVDGRKRFLDYREKDGMDGGPVVLVAGAGGDYSQPELKCDLTYRDATNVSVE